MIQASLRGLHGLALSKSHLKRGILILVHIIVNLPNIIIVMSITTHPVIHRGVYVSSVVAVPLRESRFAMRNTS